jgi:hypothetical protein
MITTQTTVQPDRLLLAAGGSIAAAMRITGDVLQRMVDAGATRANGLEPRAAWVAIVATGRHDDPEGIGVVDWSPEQPIPRGTVVLRCTGYSVSTSPESV